MNIYQQHQLYLNVIEHICKSLDIKRLKIFSFLLCRLFISEDVPIGHTQIIDTFDSSFCSIYSIKSHINNRYDIPFEILLSTNESCTLNLHVIHLLDREQTPMYTIRRQLINEEYLNGDDDLFGFNDFG